MFCHYAMPLEVNTTKVYHIYSDLVQFGYQIRNDYKMSVNMAEWYQFEP